jgi:centromeric protein E
MIDLAGSEKASAQEVRRKEGAYINKSLLTLGTVISQLTKSHPANTSPTPYSTPSSTNQPNYVPYRDSKLTRILQPSLSGAGYITILATICGGQKYSAETLSTLQFAKRAKKIPAKAIPVENLLDERFAGDAQLRAECEKYKLEIETLKKQVAEEQVRKSDSEELSQLKVQKEELNNRIEKLSCLALAAGDGRNPIVQQVFKHR